MVDAGNSGASPHKVFAGGVDGDDDGHAAQRPAAMHTDKAGNRFHWTRRPVSQVKQGNGSIVEPRRDAQR